MDPSTVLATLRARYLGVRLFGYALALALAFLATRSAAAEEFTERSYILPHGSFEITGPPARPRMVDINLSKGSGLDPVTIAPHFYWGVSDIVTVGITHQRGLCLGDNCEHPYNDAGFGMLVGLAYGRKFELVLDTGVPVRSFDPFLLGVRAGVLGRVKFGRIVAFVFDPTLYVGLTNRDQGNREGVDLPFWFYFQATDVVVPFVGSAARGPLDGFGDHFEVPLEGGVVFSVAENVDVGFVLRFDNLAGKDATPDVRSLGFIGRFRF